MKFNKLKLTGLHAVDLPIVGALPSDPYILKNADGLGPPEIDISFGSTIEGVNIHQGSRPQSRELVIHVGLNPDYGAGMSASDLRDTLYGLLTPGAAGNIKIDILDGETIVAQTVGLVKRIEVVPFSETPEVQITIPCLQTYLEAPNVLYVAVGGTKSAPEIQNVGTAKTGFRMEVIFTAPTSDWSLTQDNGDVITFLHDFEPGDHFIFDTRPSLRGAWLTRSLVTSNLIGAFATGSAWLMLHGGNNVFEASDPDYDWGDVFYRPLYWGI